MTEIIENRRLPPFGKRAITRTSRLVAVRTTVLGSEKNRGTSRRRYWNRLDRVLGLKKA